MSDIDTSLLEVRHITVSIARSPAEVYAFAAKPENMPKWASGLGASFREVDGEWIAEGGPVGKVKVRFTPTNTLGVLDHDVTLESGLVVHNPVRVVPNGEAGSEVTFTLFRQPGMSDDELERDAQMVASDLSTLKSLVERA
jgi:uncharacterized protein YndB with AHSA1/START domain